MKNHFLLLLFVSCLKVSAQKSINNYLGNGANRSAEEESGPAKTKGIYSITYFVKSGSGEKTKQPKEKINGISFLRKTYTEYIPDGRRRYKETFSDGRTDTEKYYYDDAFRFLKLQEGTNQYFNYFYWNNYNENDLLSESISWHVDKNGKPVFQSYENYNFQIDAKDTVVKIQGYGYDSLPDPVKTYHFSYPYLIAELPQYQSKWQRFKWINDEYKPIEIKGFVFEDRNVNFSYDDNGYLLSEIWYKPAGVLENKTAFQYTKNYLERIERKYQRLGSELFSTTIRKYDVQGNIIFDQTEYYDGSKGSITTYDYKYDERDNWIERITYYQNIIKGVYDTKKVIAHELRQISYFTTGSKVREMKLPARQFEDFIAQIRTEIPKRAAIKKQKIDHFNNAVETGNYEKQINLQRANTLSEFTPEFWAIRDSALGDLDGIEGDEAVVVYKTPMPAELGFASCVAVYKKEEENWKLWYQTTAPVLGDANGGMMGDPYEGVHIERRCIVIYHFGGSRQKWRYTHRYRFQNNDWYLIGATVNFGSTCDYFEKLDYNLVTGDVVIKKTTERCDDKEPSAGQTKTQTERSNIKRRLPHMNDFIPGETEIKIPGKKISMFY